MTVRQEGNRQVQRNIMLRDVYRITSIRTITSREAKQFTDDDKVMNDLRLAFELEFSHRLYNDSHKFDTRGFIKDTFLDTTFDNIPL